MNIQTNNNTLVSILRQRSIQQPQQLAVCYLADGETETESLTYQALDLAARKIAAKLQTLNLQQERAVLLYESGAEFVKAFFGCLYAGVIAVPTYVPKTKQMLQKTDVIAQDCQARIILTTQNFLQEFAASLSQDNQLAHIPHLATDNLQDDLTSEYQQTRISSENIAFLQYTSGSTSQPKGVIINHHNIIVNEQMMQQAFALSEKTVGVSWLPLFHDMGLIATLLSAIFVGYPVYIMPPVAFIKNPTRWLRCITKYKGTHILAPNFAYDLCVRKLSLRATDKIDLSSVKTAINAAEPIRRSTLESFIKTFLPYGFKENTFVPTYGLAEATVFVAGKQGIPIHYVYLNSEWMQKNKAVYAEASETDSKVLVNCGPSDYFGQVVKIVNPETKIACATQEIGEIWISGENIAQGYFQKTDLTETIFKAHLANSEHEFLRTGDLGFLNEAGELFVTGRIKDLIIIHGNNYYPQDIELTVENTDASIRKGYVAAFAVENNQTEKIIIVAEIKLASLGEAKLEELCSKINAALLKENELTASEIIFIALDTMPRTTSGKIQRQACKAKYLQNALNIIGRWKGNEAENFPDEKQELKIQLINSMVIWIANHKKIPVNNIALTVKLSDYNVDSIQMVELSNELEKILKKPISEKILYEHQTIEGIAEALINLSAHPLDVMAEKRSYELSSLLKSHEKKKIAIPKFEIKPFVKEPEEVEG